VLEPQGDSLLSRLREPGLLRVYAIVVDGEEKERRLFRDHQDAAQLAGRGLSEWIESGAKDVSIRLVEPNTEEWQKATAKALLFALIKPTGRTRDVNVVDPGLAEEVMRNLFRLQGVEAGDPPSEDEDLSVHHSAILGDDCVVTAPWSLAMGSGVHSLAPLTIAAGPGRRAEKRGQINVDMVWLAEFAGHSDCRFEDKEDHIARLEERKAELERTIDLGYFVDEDEELERIDAELARLRGEDEEPCRHPTLPAVTGQAFVCPDCNVPVARMGYDGDYLSSDYLKRMEEVKAADARPPRVENCQHPQVGAVSSPPGICPDCGKPVRG
jgi:hypothetical protein